MSPRRIRRALVAAALAAAVIGTGVVVWAGDDTDPVAALSQAGSTTGSRPRSTTSTTAPSTTTPTAAPTTTTTAAPIDVFALRPPAPAGDAAGLAAQITAAEAVLRDPAAAPAAVAEAALAQQVAYRQLGVHPEWDGAVLAAVPPELAEFVRLNAAARREFRAMHRTLSTALPAWRIVPPDPIDALRATYQEAGAAFDVPWNVLAAIHLVETGSGRIRGTSSAGAQGPMQFLPATWAAYGAGGDINSTRDAIFAAARYLKANGAPHDLTTALWNYNHNNHYVLGVQIYADLILSHPEAFRAYYHWGVWYLTAAGDVFLHVGYDEPVPKPI